MSDEKIQIETHNYDPVNKYIDDQARLKRSASTWRYAKAAALIMVAAGILAVLLAWAYYLYKKPHRLVSLSEINQKVLENEDRLIEAEKKLPKDSEISTSTKENQLRDQINDKDLEIAKLKQQLENNPENQKLEQEKNDLIKELNNKLLVRTNVIHFKQVDGTIGNEEITISTRLQYDDPTNLEPNTIDGKDPITCYVTFNNREDLKKIELGTINQNPQVTNYHLTQLGVSYNDFVNLKNKYCQFN